MTTLHEGMAHVQIEPRPQLSPRRRPDDLVNVSNRERLVMVALGGLLIYRVLRRPSMAGWGLGVCGGALAYQGIRGRCPLYGALGIDTVHQGAARPRDYYENGIHVEKSILINASAAELFRFWRNFENLPRFMSNLQGVSRLSDHISHWRAKAPAGASVEWNAQIINELPDELIAWRSLAGADVDHAGSVRFLPLPDGPTEVRVVLDYIPPAGKVGSVIASLFGREPKQQIDQDLQRLKQIIEAGEVAEISTPS